MKIGDQGPGFQWYNRSGHVFEAPIVENITTGEKFIVSKSIPQTFWMWTAKSLETKGNNSNGLAFLVMSRWKGTWLSTWTHKLAQSLALLASACLRPRVELS